MNNYEVIIIGGSYSGLSAAMALGRASRNTLVLDSGKPCNRQTPHSHNFLTQDGETPAAISAKAKEQVMAYPTVNLKTDKVLTATKSENTFTIVTENGSTYFSKKLLIATGLNDLMPDINGFSECWGISIIHCPYCHGYEFKSQKTAVMINGAMAEHFIPVLLQWTKDIVLFTNGPANLSDGFLDKLRQYDIPLIQTEIESVQHHSGLLESITLKNGDVHLVTVMYAKIPAIQNNSIAEDLGCGINETGLIEVDDFKKTNIDGVFAAGDCTVMARSIATAVENGTRAGAGINMELCLESF